MPIQEQQQQQDALPHLKAKHFVQPHHHPFLTNNTTEKVPKHYQDCIAIDIVVLPPPQLGDEIKANINKPLIEQFNSFPLDESHFPHMSITHAIVKVESLPEICGVLDKICQHIQPLLQQWQAHVIKQTHPCYTSPTEVKAMPYKPEQYQFIHNLINSQQPNDAPTAPFPLSFEWSTYGLGPQWTSLDLTTYQSTLNMKDLRDTQVHLPWIGYPNNITLDAQPATNGLTMRILHDIITMMTSQHRIFISECIEDEANKKQQQQQQITPLSGVDNQNMTLLAIAQQLYYTEKSIAPQNDPHGIKSYIPVADVEAKAKQQPFEVVEVSGLKYTNLFDTIYCGNKYNPHITIGSGPIDGLRQQLPQIFNDKEQQQQQSQQTNIFPLPQPIPMDLTACTIAVFQLGKDGSARYPLYKTSLQP